MNDFKEMIDSIPEIEAKIGYVFKDKEHLILSFIHRSFINENRFINEHNERLEFLGDTILGMTISEYLYSHLPSTPEGELSYLRSRLIDASACAEYIKSLNIGKYILLGKGERLNDGRGRESIYADLFEAILAAIYLDGGLEEVKKFIFGHFSSIIESVVRTPLHNWKALLQDYCQKKYQVAPTYKVIEEFGPDHNKMFKMTVFINEMEIGHGEGNSKKEAQQSAAANAIENLKITL